MRANVRPENGRGASAPVGSCVPCRCSSRCPWRCMCCRSNTSPYSASSLFRISSSARGCSAAKGRAEELYYVPQRGQCGGADPQRAGVSALCRLQSARRQGLSDANVPHHISRVSVACIGATPLSYDKGAFPAMMREFHRPPLFANAARPLLCLRPVTVWIRAHLSRVKCGENCTLCRKQAKISLRKGVNCKVKFSHYLR